MMPQPVEIQPEVVYLHVRLCSRPLRCNELIYLELVLGHLLICLTFRIPAKAYTRRQRAEMDNFKRLV